MIAKLCINTMLRGGKAVLANCFYTPPFKVLNITEDNRQILLHLMLMNVSPGVLDGDRYFMQFNIAAGTAVQLHTQSYQRLFHMKNSAEQTMEINMQAGSTFTYVPHPTVPHKNSDFVAKTKIQLSDKCTLIWGEIVTCGRKGNGEQFLFSKYHTKTEIFWNRRLVVKENLLLQPSESDISGLGQLEGYTHQASLIYLNEETVVQKLTDTFYAMLLLEEGICFGITALPVNGFMVRLLGYKGEQLYGLLKKFTAALMPAATMEIPKTSIKKEHAN